MFIPVCTWCPICNSDILMAFPFWRCTLAVDGKQTGGGDGGDLVVIGGGGEGGGGGGGGGDCGGVGAGETGVVNAIEFSSQLQQCAVSVL